MKYLIVICLLMFVMATYGQDTKPCPCNNELTESFETRLQGKIYVGLATIVGTEFYTPSFVKGDIFLENGKIAVDQQIRYNGRIDGLILLHGRQILLDKYFIKEFCFKDVMGLPKICFGKIKVVKDFSNDTINVFAQILYKNKLSLYAYRRYVDKEEVIEYVSNRRVSKRSFGPSFIYYFQFPNHKTIGFKKFKKRDLFHLFPDKKDAMRKLFREKHQHRFKSEADLIQITALLNEMIN